MKTDAQKLEAVAQYLKGIEKAMKAIKKELAGIEPKPKKVAKAKEVSPEIQMLSDIWAEIWEPGMNEKYRMTKTDEKIFEKMHKDGVSPNGLVIKAKAFKQVKQPYHISKRYPLWLLEKTWSELETGPAAKNEECKHPYSKLQVKTEHGGLASGRCSACGRSVTVVKP